MNSFLPSALLVFSILFFEMSHTEAQSDQANCTALIIERIGELESNRDPKCYATANRLEDFMYGSPLNNDARRLKFDIQKAIALNIRKEATMSAKKDGRDSILQIDVAEVLHRIAPVQFNDQGDRFFVLDTGEIKINKTDFRQYSSVAYIYRVLLSVEQDLLLSDFHNMLPLSLGSIDMLNDYLNFLTLCALHLADQRARDRDLYSIDRATMAEAWIYLLSHQKARVINSIEYSQPSTVSDRSNKVIRRVIEQKLVAYEAYNHINSKLFLRNIQVYFAKQRWPAEPEQSNELKNYYLESMISFTRSLLLQADSTAILRSGYSIQEVDVDHALDGFIPFDVNQFEDIIFYPYDKKNIITIEAYDLDAFRDSGIHWKLLQFALDDLSSEISTIDPQAAELLVEGIAQMGMLVLRMAGDLSQLENRPHLTISDVETAWVNIQKIIDHYPNRPEVQSESALLSSAASSDAVTSRGESGDDPFVDVTDRAGVDFHHKSSDWLSRLIRSYVYRPEDNLARLAIPPAFGGAGVACEDIDGNGFPDILLLGGHENQLLFNDGSGSFTKKTLDIDLNIWSSKLQSYGEPRQPIIVDFDNDGLQDILITYVDGFHRLYRNLGNGQFEEMTEVANMDGRGMVAGPATALDFDNDGLLDVYIGYFGNYINGELPTISRHNQNGMPNILYRNLGNFQFEEVDYLVDPDTDNGWTQAVGHSDINCDGLQDIIVGNDFGVNRYYINQGNGKFIDRSRQLGTDKPSYTMNIGIADLNRDQYPDFYISNIVVMQKDEKYVSPNEETIMKFDPEKMGFIRTVEANDLFISDAPMDSLVSYTRSDHVGRGYSATGWSWDADFFDFDNDGDDDLYVLNGMNDFRVYSSENPFYYADEDSSNSIVYAPSSRERNVFFVNENGEMVNKAQKLNMDLYDNARSAAYLDYDMDGDLDVIINNYHNKGVLMSNESDNERHWIKVRLIGDPSAGVNRDAIGATIVLDGKKKLWREVHSTTGYLSVHPKEQHFGLGEDETVKMTVTWPNGVQAVMEDVSANRRYQVIYPDSLQMVQD